MNLEDLEKIKANEAGLSESNYLFQSFTNKDNTRHYASRGVTPKQAPTPKSSKSKGGTKTFDFDSERSFESFVNEIEDHKAVEKDFQEFFVQ